MKKEASKVGSMQPCPNALVSCKDKDGRMNALAVAYCCNCSFDPPMLMVGIVPSRFSHHIVKETGCFVVNLTPKEYAETYYYLGKASGRDEDKFQKGNVAYAPGAVVDAPVLTDCPVNIECTVVDSILTGSHEMFVGRVEYVHCDEEYIGDDGKIDFSKIDLL